jgi:aldehyde dehydrogenase (NAD+)
MYQDILKSLGIEESNSGGFAGEWVGSGPELEVLTPIDGSRIAVVQQVTEEEYDEIVDRAHAAFLEWRKVPAPRRGDIVRQVGNALREKKEALGALVSLEMGKIVAEGEGEVQEMVDICDFAVGLSRQLYGLTMPSERPDHRMMEQWHPLGVVGVISAFNFPVAVWSWNAALAAVCGDATLWKPASGTPLTAIAVTKIAAEVCRENHVDPAIFSLVVGKGSTVGDRLLHDKRIPLVSATGSCAVGKRVAKVVGERFGKMILELGGNNAIIVTPHAEMGMVLPAILFGAVGTAGQRCTSTRRIIAHASIKDQLVERLVRAYEDVRIGDSLDPGRSSTGASASRATTTPVGTTSPRASPRRGTSTRSSRTRPSRPSSTSWSTGAPTRRRPRPWPRWKRPWPSTTASPRDSPPPSSPNTCGRPSTSSPTAAATAGSPT